MGYFINDLQIRDHHTDYHDRQAITTAVLLLEACKPKYGWMWTEGISGEDVAAAARSVVEHAE